MLSKIRQFSHWNKVDDTTQKLCLTAFVNKTYDEVMNEEV